MIRPLFAGKTHRLAGASILIPCLFLSLPGCAQNPQKNVSPPRNVEQELVRIETGFFEAWKMKDLTYFREHIADNGIFGGEYGAASRAQQLEEQQGSAKSCKV